VVVEFKGGADLRVPQFRKLGIVDHDEGVLRVDVLDNALLQRRTAIQTGVVQSDHADPW
jgi:hypothetical protein